VWITSDLATAHKPTAIALGNFDGVHRGHQQVIQALSAQDLALSRLTVVAFDPHPQAYFSGQTRTLLTPVEEKCQILAEFGVEQLVLLAFNRELANLSPQNFVEQILIQQLDVRAISIGFNFRFGYRRSGSAEDLQAIAATHGIPVQIVSPQQFEGERISSSAIRAALSEGNLAQANRLLGRCYPLVGPVIVGDRLGHTLGFPTANLQISANKFMPRKGVYAVRVEGMALENPQVGVMNLGCRPTVNGTEQRVEVHLLDWSGNLYGQTLTVSLERYLRSEQRFASLDALKTQIQQDCDATRRLMKLAV
jgi:riboflavin kinase / FMN adenylyltransferase